MATTNPILKAAQNKATINNAEVAPDTVATPTQTPQAGEAVSRSTSQTTIVRSRIQDPDPVDSGLQSVNDSIDVGLEQGRIFTNQLIKSSERTEQLNDAAATAVANTVDSKITQVRQAGVSQMQAESDSQRVFDAMGGADRLVDLAAGRREAVDRSIEAQLALQENIDAEFLEDPLQFIANQFTVGFFREESDVAKQTVATFDNAINNITSLASATDQTLQQLKTTVTGATMSANADILVQDAVLQATQFKLAAERTNAEVVTAGLAMSKEETNAQIKKWQLGLQARTETDRKTERDLRRKALEKNETFRTTLVDGVLSGRKRMGVTIYTGNDPTLIKEERDKIFTEYQLGGERKGKIAAQFDVGIGTVAPTAFQTLSAISATDPTRFTDGSNRALAVLSDSMANVGAASRGELTGTAKFKLTKDNAAGLVNEQFRAQMEAAEKVIKSSDAENPNLAIPLSGLISQAPSLREDPLTKGVLLPLFTEEVKDFTAEKVFELAVAAIKSKRNPEGPLSFEEAVAGIQAIYSQAVVYNNNSQDRERLGLPLQTSYRAKLSGRFSSKEERTILGITPGVKLNKTINFLDASEVRAAMVKAKSFNELQLPSLFNLTDRTQEK